MGNEAIDLKDVMERVQDDKELLLELLVIFQEDFLKKRQALEQAIMAGDIAKIKELAHSVKGASGNISARSMHATCVQLEQLAKSNTTTGMMDLVKQIDREFVLVQTHAEQLKKEWGGG